MNPLTIRLLCCFLLLTRFDVIIAQQHVISGTITDKLTGQPLPYATVVLKKKHTGIAANEHGQFDLHIPPEASADTLVVNVFGYRRTALPVSGLSSPLVIGLMQHAVDIEEVTVTPQPPEYYVRQAIRRLKKNYPTKPFETIAFYREMVRENNAFVQCDEAVFRSYCPNYLDTTKNHDQVLLYRQADEISPVAFMSEDRKTRKARRKGKPLPAADTTQKKNKVNFAASSFGGPQEILRSSKPGKAWTFLDTTMLRSYRYAFGGNTTFNDNDVMIIEFKSRGKVDHTREHGKLYIDRRNFAIVRIENEGDMVIPFYLRPILFSLGIGITNPHFTRDMEFQQVAGRWYPQKVLYDIDLTLTKRYIFSPNEHSRFRINQVFAVSRLEVEKPAGVPGEKRFNTSKPIREQVHGETPFTWDNVNVVRR